MDDTISRQDALDIVDELNSPDWYMEWGAEARRRLVDLPPAQPERHWIPCSERLPKQGQEVICQCRASIIKVLKLDANGDWYQDADHCYMGGFVIAWMPLPECYRGENDGEGKGTGGN